MIHLIHLSCQCFSVYLNKFIQPPMLVILSLRRISRKMTEMDFTAVTPPSALRSFTPRCSVQDDRVRNYRTPPPQTKKAKSNSRELDLTLLILNSLLLFKHPVLLDLVADDEQAGIHHSLDDRGHPCAPGDKALDQCDQTCGNQHHAPPLERTDRRPLRQHDTAHADRRRTVEIRLHRV